MFKRTIVFILFFSHFFLTQSWSQQIHVENAPANGVFIQDPTLDGMHIQNAGGDGIQIDSAETFGIRISDPKFHGLLVDNAGTDGIFLNFPADDGVHIFHAGDNGLEILAPADKGALISSAGGNGVQINSPENLGIQILGSGNHGVHIFDAGHDAISIEHPEDRGVAVIAPGGDGIYIQSSGINGIRVEDAGNHGIFLESSDADGVHVEDATNDAVQIEAAGRYGINIVSAVQDGVRITNTGDDGVAIGQTGGDGVQVVNAGGHGIRVVNGNADGLRISNPGDDGISISNASDDGIVITGTTNDGIHIDGAGGSAGIFANSPSSNSATLHVTHGNDIKPDVKFGGNARLHTDGDFRVRLDQNDNSYNGFYIERSVADGGAWVFAAWESGDAQVIGNLTKGGGSFKIDHPLDPENKYLYHSFVESPDMMNVYNGNVILNESGEALVEMENWFEALNRDFRYQLSPIGAPAPNLFIAEEMVGNSFRIAGGEPGTKVSWQVTGVRQDPFANENRIPTAVMKEEFNRGKYLHAKEWAKVKGVSSLQGISLAERYDEIETQPISDAGGSGKQKGSRYMEAENLLIPPVDVLKIDEKEVSRKNRVVETATENN